MVSYESLGRYALVFSSLRYWKLKTLSMGFIHTASFVVGRV